MDGYRLKVPCPRCGRRLEFGEEAIGRKGRCVSCGSRLAVLRNGRLYALEESPRRQPTVGQLKAYPPGWQRPATRKPATETAVPSTQTPAPGVAGCSCPADDLEIRRGRPWRLPWAEQVGLIAAAALVLVVVFNPGSGQTKGAPNLTQLIATVAPATRPAPPATASPAVPFAARKDNGTAIASGAATRPALSAAGRLRPSGLLQRGLAHCRDGRYEEGLRCLDQIITAEPDHPVAHYYRGRTLHCLKRHVEAVIAFDRSIRLDDNLPEVHFHRGNALSALGDHTSAIDAYQRSIALSPDAAAYCNMGVAYAESGMRERSLEAFQTALRLDPKHAQSLANLALSGQQPALRTSRDQWKNLRD